MSKRLNILSGRALHLCRLYPNNAHAKAVVKLLARAKRAPAHEIPVICEMALFELSYLER